MICVYQDIILFFDISKFSLSFPILKSFIVISRLFYLLLTFCSAWPLSDTGETSDIFSEKPPFYQNLIMKIQYTM